MSASPNVAATMALFAKKVAYRINEKAAAPQLVIRSISDFIVYRNLNQTTFEVLIKIRIQQNWELQKLDIPIDIYSEKWIALFLESLNQGNIEIAENRPMNKMCNFKLNPLNNKETMDLY
jgi:hypothetical protein